MNALLCVLMIAWHGDSAMPGGPDAFQTSPLVTRDAILFADPGPIVLRFGVTVAGRDVDTLFRDYATRRFHALDADRDGILTAREASPRSLGGQFRDLGRALTTRRGGANPVVAFPAGGIRGASAYADYLTKLTPPLKPTAGAPADPRTKALFERLDGDGDKVLSEAERAALDALLGRSDGDGDELINLAELTPYDNPLAANNGFVANAYRPPNNDPNALTLVLIDPRDPRTTRDAADRWFRWAEGRRLVVGKNSGRRLPPAALRRDAAEFAKADADADRGLSVEELAGYLASSLPDFVVTVRREQERSSAPSGPELVVERGNPGLAAEAKIDIRRDAPNSAALVAGALTVALTSQRAGEAVDIAQFYVQQFTFMDGDSNGYVDKKENMGNGIFNGDIFAQIDRDSNGMMFREELDWFLGQHRESAACRAELGSVDLGPLLFPAADANGDMQLSRRELRQLAGRWGEWDRDGDKAIKLDEVPRSYEIAIGPGQIEFEGMVQFGVARQRATTPRMGSGAGPTWFRGMDRNNDGDVSSNEFLGPAEVFGRLDRDGDSLISADEAAQR